MDGLCFIQEKNCLYFQHSSGFAGESVTEALWAVKTQLFPQWVSYAKLTQYRLPSDKGAVMAGGPRVPWLEELHQSCPVSLFGARQWGDTVRPQSSAPTLVASLHFTSAVQCDGPHCLLKGAWGGSVPLLAVAAGRAVP